MKADLKNTENFLAFKKNFCKKNSVPQPTNANLREIYEEMLKMKLIKRSPEFEKTMLSRAIRTQSGVAVVAVLTKPYPCPGQCVYCPNEKGMPKSYLSNEPAVMRAIASGFHPFIQVQNRIKALELNGHITDKIELIVMGGTFSSFPESYQKWFIAKCFRACNEYPKSATHATKRETHETLNKEQKRNEKAKHRIIGLTLETRPDYINKKEIINFRNLGCTRVELGVQSIFDDVLKINKRGHGIQETIEATKLLKNSGFKISYHIMPGLPGSTLKKDHEMFRELFRNPSFQPDMLKIYPTVIIKNSLLHKIWKKPKNGKNKILHNTPIGALYNMRNYKPLSDKKFAKLTVKVKNEIIPPYVRISRLVRDVPATSIIAGPKISNLRQLIAKESKCQCIRCREVRSNYDVKEKILLNRIDYAASDGQEIFLQFVSEDKKKLFALLRLFIPENNNKDHFIPALKNAALIREVHTYGKLAKIDTRDKISPQHIGLGKKLIKEAEKIAAKEFGSRKIAVISGVGARNYYRKLGFKLENTYMVKNIFK